MNWTEEQNRAIKLRNKNILVAAAAGSGKTAVLVERVRSLILDERCPVERMLIVTFTNAAAAEMKDKISKALTEAAGAAAVREREAAASAAGRGREAAGAAAPAGRENAAAERGADVSFIKRQLAALPSANISTFHAFAMEVLHRYFHLVGIEPNFGICDDVQGRLLKEEAMQELFDELFEEGGADFYVFLRKYSDDRSERKLKGIIENNYRTLMSLPEPFEWLQKSVEELKDGEGFLSGRGAESIFSVAEDKLREAADALVCSRSLAEAQSVRVAEFCEADGKKLAPLLAAVKTRDYGAFRTALGEFKLDNFKSGIFDRTPEGETLSGIVKTNRDAAKALINDIKKKYFALSEEELRKEIGQTYEPAKYLCGLIRRYHELYSQKKREKNLIDFNDVEHYAYEILKDGEAADFYRNKFAHIFIDEYQDNSVIQEAIVNLIKRENNLFMVGDVKQCIYKFRLAEPEIFQRKYAEYARGEDENSEKIDLNRNFRSKRPVIDFINGIFRLIMPGYDDNAALYAGDPYADENGVKPRLYLCAAPWNLDGDEELSDGLKAVIKAEKEAMAAVRLINDNLGKPIFDSKLGRERPLEKRDIVILTRSMQGYGGSFYKVLTASGIPAFVDDNDGFFDTIEVESFLAALKVIDNPRQDVPLLTLMHSEMEGFSARELAEIRIAFKTGSYYEALKSYAQEGTDAALRQKCQKTLADVEEWRNLSRLLPLDRLIWKLLLDSGFYMAMGAIPGGSQRQANLRALADKALAYRSGGGGTLYGFIRYVETIKKNGVKIGQVKMLGEKDDVVRIMTVHKSKGLEFPMVILAGFCKKIKYDAGKDPVMHKDVGLGLPIVNEEKRWYKTTLIQNLISDFNEKSAVEEEKRILYVALTRAKDRLALLGITGSPLEDLNNVMSREPSKTSYFTLAGRAVCRDADSVVVMSDEEILSAQKSYGRSVRKALARIEEQAAGRSISPEVRGLMEFAYPYEDDLVLKSKYSVSEINRELAAGEAGEEGRTGAGPEGESVGAGPEGESVGAAYGGRLPSAASSLRVPAFAAGKASLTAAERGTAYHCALEHMDLARARSEGLPYVEEMLEGLVEREILFAEEAQTVESKKLLDFARSDLGRRISESPSVRREQPFNLLMEYGGKQVIAQGMIDCFFEEGDGLVLLDYKTGGRRDAASGYENVKKRYAAQIEIYRQALEKATGRKVKEAYLYLTDAGEILRM